MTEHEGIGTGINWHIVPERGYSILQYNGRQTPVLHRSKTILRFCLLPLSNVFEEEPLLFIIKDGQVD